MNYTSQSSNPLANIPPVIKNLLIINLLVFIASLTFEAPMYRYLALYYPGSTLFMPHQLFTYMFMHGGFAHLFFNMYALWIFGSSLEQLWGSKRFLIFYIVTGIGAALLYNLVQWIQFTGIEASMTTEQLSNMYNIVRETGFNEHISQLHAQDLTIALHGVERTWFSTMTTPMVGASGAIFGVLLGFGMFFPNTVLQLLFPPVRLKAKHFVMIYGALELFLTIQQPGDGVAHLAHIGGMLFGFILIKLWQRKNKRKKDNFHQYFR